MSEPGLGLLEQNHHQQININEHIEDQQNANNQLLDQQNIININNDAQMDEEARRLAQANKKMGLAKRLSVFKSRNYDVSDYAHMNIDDVSITKLHDEYGQTYQDKNMFKSREKKIKNKKSRLYKKDQNAKTMEARDKERREERNDEAAMRRAVPDNLRKKISFQELKDISVLSNIFSEADITKLPPELNRPEAEVNRMNKADKARYLKKREEKLAEIKKTSMKDNFNDLLAKYVSLDATDDEKENNALEIMTKVTEKLMKYDFAAPKLTDDAYIAKNAKLFEDMNNLIDIYHRLNKKYPEAIKKISTEVQSKLNDKVTRLEDMGNYYRIRKLLITNPYYRTHYNEELSFNADKQDSAEKKLLAKQLRASYYLGKNLQKYAFHFDEKSGGQERFNAAQRQGSNQAMTPVLNAGSNDYIRKAEGQLCLISAFKEDTENITTPVIKALQDALATETNKEAIDDAAILQKEENIAKLKSQIAEEKKRLTDQGYQVHARSILAELEREQTYLPPEEFKIDLKTVGNKPLTKEKIMLGALSSKSGNNNIFLAKTRTKKTYEARGKIVKMITKHGAGHDGIDSKKYGKIDGTDDFPRLIDLFSSIYCDYLPEEEVVEMVENITRPNYEEYKNSNDPEIQNMLDDYYMEGLATYYSSSYQMMRQVLEGVGDKFNFMCPEDMVRHLSPKFASIVTGGVLTTMGNATQTGGVSKFLYFTGDKYSYMQDFWAVYNSISSMAFITLLPSKAISNTVTSSGQGTAYKQQLTQELTPKYQAICANLFKQNTSEQDIEDYFAQYPNLTEEQAKAKQREILNPELDEETVYKLTSEANIITARLKTDDNFLYTIEKAKPTMIHGSQLTDVADDEKMSFEELYKDEVYPYYASNEGGFEFFKTLYPENAEEYTTSEEDKQEYINNIPGYKLNPFSAQNVDINNYKKSVKDNVTDLMTSYATITGTVNQQIKEAEDNYKNLQNQNA